MSRRLFASCACLLVLAFTFVACDQGGEDLPERPEPPARPRSVPASAYRTTASGLKIYDFETGSGPAAVPGDVVTVEYTGWLRSDSTRFDSSVGREPFTFQLGAGRVIEGWDEGVVGMRVGGERSLVIPPELAYGDTGAGSAIPPGATLIFEIELLDLDRP